MAKIKDRFGEPVESENKETLLNVESLKADEPITDEIVKEKIVNKVKDNSSLNVKEPMIIEVNPEIKDLVKKAFESDEPKVCVDCIHYRIDNTVFGETECPFVSFQLSRYVQKFPLKKWSVTKDWCSKFIKRAVKIQVKK